MERSKKTVFKGVINGVEYDDLEKFNKAVHDIDDHDNISISTELKTVYEDEECGDKCICGKECKCTDDTKEGKKEYKSVFTIDVDEDIEDAERGNVKTYYEYENMALGTCNLVNSDNADDVIKEANELLDKVSLNKQVLDAVDRELKEKIDRKLKEAEELEWKREQNKKALITADNIENCISIVKERAVNLQEEAKTMDNLKEKSSKEWTSSIFNYDNPFRDVTDLLKFFAW